jgi:hypothetical protein
MQDQFILDAYSYLLIHRVSKHLLSAYCIGHLAAVLGWPIAWWGLGNCPALRSFLLLVTS